MIQRIVEEMKGKLEQLFGPDCTIHTEPADSQEGPSMFLCLLSDRKKPLLGSRFSMEYSFDLQYHPGKAQKTYEACEKAAQILYDNLLYLPVGDDLTRGKDMNSNITDGVLHFFVTYPLMMVQEEPEDDMEEVTVHATEKK